MRSAELWQRNDLPAGMNWLRHESKSPAFHESPTMSALLLIFIAIMQSVALQFMERSEKS